MGTLYLVRHGQASFGAADYDQLSALGQQQAVQLGRYWAERGLRFDAVMMGTLRRHVQTWEGIREGADFDMEPLSWPGLNEYDGEAVVRAICPDVVDKPLTPEGYKRHFHMLRDGLSQWMGGTISPRGMPTYPAFVEGVTSALDHVRTQHPGRKVLIVSSGGPISTAVGHVLALSPERTIDLNMRIRNSSITEFQFGPKRHALVTFNTLPHLDQLQFADWVTSA
ncbi:histidine phosphatase family protein [Hydrogenophaga crassostreae]|uniref:Histidine phosphatase family protein n=1 Tax=Hydrogenophaga crassostreae TaxID=1763535 RepID=A0A170AH87_9BURK|nr:histidine phosphatase family protein [Hydrogenophaga crassostreae]AOW15308.1 histidine phosphatase family protein [Hydrogenophaga crassostreae]OAD43927.1 histidine phosphatase family protein [Hydrogenophaga crassostreae]